MGWQTYDEAIDLVERRFQFLPQAFRWRGRRYDVDVVERDWTRSRPVVQRYFRVQCPAGLVELCHDLTSNTWRLWRARWAEPRPARATMRSTVFWKTILKGRTGKRTFPVYGG